jgi:hypothetical protein
MSISTAIRIDPDPAAVDVEVADDLLRTVGS